MPDRPATLRDVAAAARVHPATASRALNPETRILVSEETARRVTDADASRERILFEQMRARHVDGFVLATATLHDQLLADAAAADVPVVLMNRLAPDYSFPSVSV